MLPGLAAVGGAPDAVADRGTLAVVRLARADVDDVRIGRRNGDGADRFIRHVVEHRMPVKAAVGRLPHAAGGEADVQQHRILFGADDIVQAAHHHRRSDGAEFKTAQHRIGGLVGFGLGGPGLRPDQTSHTEAGCGDDQGERQGILRGRMRILIVVSLG